MKRSLSKVLARMAKDGDLETVAEIIEEMIEPEDENADPGTPDAEPCGEPAAEEPSAGDEAVLEDVILRLDRIIELLTPGPASDEDPIEEIAEAVEEAIEAATAEEEPVTDEETGEVLDPEEIAEMGFQEQLNGDGVSLIEWSEQAPEYVPERRLAVRLRALDENTREISFEPLGGFPFSEEQIP